MLGSWFSETGTLPLFEARCVIVLGYSLWRYQFLDFREYTPCCSVRCGIRTKFPSGQPKIRATVGLAISALLAGGMTVVLDMSPP